MSRYHVSNSEGQYEKNSGEQVLANKLGISDADEIDGAELVLLEQLYHSVFEEQFPLGRITVNMLKNWHRRWLGNIYEWAGQTRTVNISKGGFMFAPSAQLPKLLHEFNTQYLARYTPCVSMSKEQLIEAIAIIHVELILIHPFREGNGRLSRLLDERYPVFTFGTSKGLTFERVIIYPTAPMLKWLQDENAVLTNETRAKLYVGLTRPVKSVAIVFNGSTKFNTNGLKIYVAG